MRKLLVSALTAIAALTAATASSAGPLVAYTTDGAWANALPAVGVTINNAGDPRTVRWGVPNLVNQSGYDFSPTGGNADVDGAAFLLGLFNHQNWPIDPPFLSSVDLNFSLSLAGAVPSPLLGTFSFTHEETPNFAPCTYGATNGPCNDKVTVSGPALDQLVTIGGLPYYFNLLGFSTDMGTTFVTDFITGEGQGNPAGLYGRLSSQPVIPEPTSLLLLGSGLLGAAARRRRRQ